MYNSIGYFLFPKCNEDICEYDEKGSLPIGNLVIKTSHNNVCSETNTAPDCKKTETILIG
jgi:hypothetical protein